MIATCELMLVTGATVVAGQRNKGYDILFLSGQRLRDQIIISVSFVRSRAVRIRCSKPKSFDTITPVTCKSKSTRSTVEHLVSVLLLSYVFVRGRNVCTRYDTRTTELRA